MDCLAATGTDDFLPYLIIAGILVLAGVGGLFLAKRRAGWAALAIVPLLLGATLLGAGASPAQANSGTSCETSPPATVPTTDPTPAPTECAPGILFDDIAVSDDIWQYDDEPVPSLVASWVPADYPEIADLIAASTGLPEMVTATAYGTVFEGQLPSVEAQVVVNTSYVLDTETGELSVGYNAILDAIAALYPGGPDEPFFSMYAMTAVILVPYDDGCGGTLTATITVNADIEAN